MVMMRLRRPLELFAALALAAHPVAAQTPKPRGVPQIPLVKRPLGGEYRKALDALDTLRRKLDSIQDPTKARRMIDEMSRSLLDVHRTLWNLELATKELALMRQQVLFLRGIDLAEKSWQVAWRKGGEELGVLQFRSKVRLFNRDLTEKSEGQLGDTTTHFAFGPLDETLAYNRPHEVLITERKTGRRVRIKSQSDQPKVAYSPDGRHLVTTQYGLEADMWSVADGSHVRAFPVQGTKGGLTATFSPDGRIIAIGNRNDRTHVFATESGEELYVLDRKSTHGLAFSPDGSRLAVAYVDGKIGIWNVQTGKLIKLLSGEGEEVFTLQWSPDGTLLVSAGLNGPIVVWSAKYLAKLHALNPGSNRVFDLAFRPDGRVLVAAGNQKTRAWTIRTTRR